jgi:hypothetical protein
MCPAEGSDHPGKKENYSRANCRGKIRIDTGAADLRQNGGGPCENY